MFTQVSLASQVAHLEGHRRRIPASPLLEVGHALEPLAGLRKLEDGIVVVDLVGDVLVLIARGALPVPPDQLSPLGLAHAVESPTA
jgi:hypothetical protein